MSPYLYILRTCGSKVSPPANNNIVRDWSSITGRKGYTKGGWGWGRGVKGAEPVLAMMKWGRVGHKKILSSLSTRA